MQLLLLKILLALAALAISTHASPFANPVTDAPFNAYSSVPLNQLVNPPSPCTPTPSPPADAKKSMEPIARRALPHPDDKIKPLDLSKAEDTYMAFLKNLTQSNRDAQEVTVGNRPGIDCYPRQPTTIPVPKASCKYLISEAFLDPWIFPGAVMSWAFLPKSVKSIAKHLPDDGNFEWGGCVIQVDNVDRDVGQVGYFSLIDVATAAVNVLESCVTDDPGSGGGAAKAWGGTSRVVREGQVMGQFYVSLRGDFGSREGEGGGPVVSETRVER